jgi:hypothetical protein
MRSVGRIATHRLIYVTTGTPGLFLSIEQPPAKTKRLRLSRKGSIQSLLAFNNSKSAVALFHKLVSWPNRWAAQRYDDQDPLQVKSTIGR